MKKQGREDVPNVLVVLSDGLPTGGISFGSLADVAFKKARAAGTQVWTSAWTYQSNAHRPDGS